MPSRYADTLLNRPELRDLYGDVIWIEEKTLIAEADAVVVARRPEDQERLLPLLLDSSRVQAVLLEKPLAPTPDRAFDMLTALRSSGKSVRIGYTFNQLVWANSLKAALRSSAPPQAISISWRFRAHHFATGNTETWKRDHRRGGGALRFYGIQVIALLAELGYSRCESSTTSGKGDDVSEWRARFTAPHLPPCEVIVDSDAEEPSFEVQLSHRDSTSALEERIELCDPFADESSIAGQDRRVLALTCLLRSLLEVEPNEFAWYEASLGLWAAAEDAAGVVRDQLKLGLSQ